jgi:hypothetical protein
VFLALLLSLFLQKPHCTGSPCAASAPPSSALQHFSSAFTMAEANGSASHMHIAKLKGKLKMVDMSNAPNWDWTDDRQAQYQFEEVQMVLGGTVP